jgi:hypothetical protein
VNLPEECRSHCCVVGAFDLLPDRSVGVAETPRGAQDLRVRERQGGPREKLRLLAIRAAARDFGSVEADLLVRTVAKRLVS